MGDVMVQLSISRFKDVSNQSRNQAAVSDISNPVRVFPTNMSRRVVVVMIIRESHSRVIRKGGSIIGVVNVEDRWR